MAVTFKTIQTFFQNNWRLIKKFIKNNSQQISNNNKIIALISPANVLLLCANHDKMIDNFLININNKPLRATVSDVCNNKYKHKFHKNILCINEWNNNQININTSIINYYKRKGFIECYNYIFDNIGGNKKINEETNKPNLKNYMSIVLK